MDNEDCRQHLESCIHLEQSKQRSDVEAFNGLLEDFKDDMEEVIICSSKTKLGFVKKARSILDGSRSQVIENRVQVNKQIKRSVIRISGALFAAYIAFSAVAAIKSAVDNQFCEFYNVQGRTKKYETQKPCEQ